MLRGKGVFLTSLGQSLRPPESFKGCLGSGKGGRREGWAPRGEEVRECAPNPQETASPSCPQRGEETAAPEPWL